MTIDIRLGITAPNGVDPQAFLVALRNLARQHGVVIYEDQSREYVWDLAALGLNPQLVATLQEPPFTVTGVDDLCQRWSEEGLLDPSLKGIGIGRIRQITLALAKAGRALKGSDVVDYYDLVEHLKMSLDSYWTLRQRCRRISEVFLLDAVDVEALGIYPSNLSDYMARYIRDVLLLDAEELARQGIPPETLAIYRSKQESNQMLAPLKAHRTLADLNPNAYAREILEEAGISLTTLVCDLTESGIGPKVQWVRKLLEGYGVELPA